MEINDYNLYFSQSPQRGAKSLIAGLCDLGVLSVKIFNFNNKIK